MTTPSPRAHTRLRRIAVVGAATAALTAIAGPATAHVTVTPSTTAAGSYSVLTFSVGHGCDGSPTTKIAIAMPEEVLAVTPTVNPLWKVSKTREALAEPITDAHGNTVTERDATVVYVARKPLIDGFRDTFELSVQLPANEGTALAFPVVQTCQKGETPWTEIAAEGQDAEELESPAPVFTLTASDGGGHGAGTDDGATDDATDEGHDEAESAETAESDSPLGAIGLGVGLLGLLAGGTALWQVRRQS